MTKKQDRAAEAIFDHIAENIRKIRDAGNVATPSDAVILDAITGCINSRDGRWRRSKPKDDGPASLLWDLVKFHRGTGSLYGYPWFSDKDMRDQLDTVALLLLGNRSNAATNWKRALYG